MLAARHHGFPVDGHVHFHRLERVAATLDAAASNFRPIAANTALLGAVLLVQSAREQVFEHLLAAGPFGGWRFSSVAAEPCTLIAQSDAGRVAVICGRQIRCERGLEVLALGTVEHFPEGEPLAQSLTRVQHSGALAAVPWGFGKWSGKRAGVIRALFENGSPQTFFVGDNGGRVQRFAVPELLQAAVHAGFRVLPGSDPFPFGNDEHRVGAFGFVADLQPGIERPWSDLRTWLESQAGSPPAYGHAMGLGRFVLNQIGIQIYNRAYARAAA